MALNIFLNDPPRVYKKVELTKTLDNQLIEDTRLLKELEENFTKSNLHHNYLQHHFLIQSDWKDKYGDDIIRDDLSILNLYLDRAGFTDTLYIDYANLGLGIFYFMKNDPDKSLSHLNSISNQELPLSNYYKAKIYLKLSDTASAISYFKAELKSKNILQDEVYHELIEAMSLSGKNNALYSMINSEIPAKYFSPQLLSKLYFLNNKIPEYFSILIPFAFRDFKWTGFVAALTILFAWGFYMYKLDIFEKEPTIVLLAVLLSGMIFSILCFYLYDFLNYQLGFYKHKGNLFLYSIFGIGIVEELVKILPLLILLVFNSKIINEPYDYILYAAISALGFSFMENLMYFDGNLNQIIHGRALTSVPGHIIDSSIAAYGLVLAKYRYKSLNSFTGFIIFFLLAAINHGLYDYWIFADLDLVFLIGFVLSISIWIVIINNCLNNSPSFSYVNERSDNVQIVLSLSLFSILIIEYVLVAWENGPGYANESFNSNLIVAAIMISYYSSRLNNMDLIRGYWATIPIRTIGEKKSGTPFNIRNFIIRFLSGDTFKHSFVHIPIRLGPHPDNHKLSQHLTNPFSGIISDRLVVTTVYPDGELYEDPYWFRIDTPQAINVGGSIDQVFLFRFEDNYPSFETNKTLVIYLFAVKDNHDLKSKIKREHLRALGKALIEKNS